MRELPVEDADEAVLVDDDVPNPVVAVRDDRCARLRPVLAQPPQAELDGWVRLADVVELVDHALESRLLQERKPLARNGVDLRELFRELDGQLRRDVHTDDPPADRLAVEPFHDKGFAAFEVSDVADRSRNLYPCLVRGFENFEFFLQGKRVSMDDADRGTADEQAFAAGVNRPGLLRRTAGEEDGLRHGTQHGFERFTHVCAIIAVGVHRCHP